MTILSDRPLGCTCRGKATWCAACIAAGFDVDPVLRRILDTPLDPCKTGGMTNTTHITHTASFVVRLDDVRASTVVAVMKAAVQPLAGSAVIESMTSDTTVRGARIIDVTLGFFATNDNEAKRTARVMRAAVDPLVTGTTIVGVRPVTA